jgi:hypothetical protein
MMTGFAGEMGPRNRRGGDRSAARTWRRGGGDRLRGAVDGCDDAPARTHRRWAGAKTVGLVLCLSFLMDTLVS